MAGVLALASMPVAFGLMAKRAFAQGGLPQGIIDVLNFALTLEELENEFYVTGLASGGLIPGVDQPIFQQIRKHETAHVALLRSVLGASAVDKPTFDFTAGGTLDPFNDYPTFQLLSQAFEDTGVRAYKGQAAALMADNTDPDDGAAHPFGRSPARFRSTAASGSEGLDHGESDRQRCYCGGVCR